MSTAIEPPETSGSFGETGISDLVSPRRPDWQPEPPRKRRRKVYSCSNCHKLKAKCDRQAPCNGCVRRKLGDQCSLFNNSLDSTAPGSDIGLPASNEPRPSTGPFQSAAGTAPNAPPSTGFNIRAPLSGPTVSDTVSLYQSDHQGDSDEESSENEPGVGTLIIDDDGRSLFFGAHAGSDWLREPDHAAITPYIAADKATGIPAIAEQRSFPFSMPKLDALSAMAGILHTLPPRDDVWQLSGCYYRHFAWNYDIVERKVFDAMVERIYDSAHAAAQEGISSSRMNINPHELALFFIILASGCQYNLELQINDPLANHYLLLSQRCLSMGSFLTKNTIVAVQALNIMGHYYLPTDQRGDSSWPLWGLSMRMIQAMGLHRDGSRWNLSEDVVDERRRVFWEAHTADVFQAGCFSRPNALGPNQFDTKFPEDKTAPSPDVRGYYILKFGLARLSLPILSLVTAVTSPPYSKVTECWQAVCEYERHLPFYMRCKSAWTAMVSVNQNMDPTNINPTVPYAPEVSAKDFRLTMQQHNLALNCCEAVLLCQRSFFTRALCQTSKELSASKYYSSFLAVFERCLGIVAITKSLHAVYPTVSYRHWNFYYDMHTAAVCFSTVVILRPTCFLAPFAMSELHTISLNSVLAIQKRAQERFEAQMPPPSSVLDDMSAACGMPSRESSAADPDEYQEHVPMLGWDTRLVRRLRAGAQANETTIPRSDGKAASTSQPAVTSVPGPVLSPMAPPSVPASVASFQSGNVASTSSLNFDDPMPVAGQDWDFWMDWFRSCNPEGQ